ncbi:MAG TPA: glycosyltransferase family 4 protein [Gammaproteobacteria bacterium]|nr:glycosyltransferase family 4 protein [Gammaproteobacteria bacterium]
MKIALVGPSLGGGGAERVLTTLANAWVTRGREIVLVTLSGTDDDTYLLRAQVRRIGLEMLKESACAAEGLINNLHRIRILRRTFGGIDPDVVLSFTTTTNILSVLSCTGTGIPVVVSERASAQDHPPTGPWRRLLRHAYRRAAAVVVQTEAGARWFRGPIGDHVYVVPNPLPAWATRQDMEPYRPDMGGSRSHRLIAMGRLERQKGFDLLLEAFAGIAHRYPDWVLVVAGEGSLRDELQGQARRLGLADRVSFPGFLHAPLAVLRAGDAFVLSSRYEGMPNALLEAMACGMPCVSFDCRTGPGELIDHEVDGLLVPPEDVEGLGQALARVMGDPSLRRRLGRGAARVTERFNVDRIITEWESVFSRVSTRRGRNCACGCRKGGRGGHGA